MQVVPQETTVTLDPEAIEAQLKTYIRTALEQSRSKECSHQEAMALLDRAWEFQKLLWQMRREEIPVTVKLQLSLLIAPQMIAR